MAIERMTVDGSDYTHTTWTGYSSRNSYVDVCKIKTLQHLPRLQKFKALENCTELTSFPHLTQVDSTRTASQH